MTACQLAYDLGICVLCQIVVEAEAYSSAPGLLRRGLEELLQHLLATFTTILDEQLSGEALLCAFALSAGHSHI